jgi:hypothetical protein
MGRSRWHPPANPFQAGVRRCCQRHTLGLAASPCSTKSSRPSGRSARRTSPSARSIRDRAERPGGHDRIVALVLHRERFGCRLEQLDGDRSLARRSSSHRQQFRRRIASDHARCGRCVQCQVHPELHANFQDRPRALGTTRRRYAASRDWRIERYARGTGPRGPDRSHQTRFQSRVHLVSIIVRRTRVPRADSPVRRRALAALLRLAQLGPRRRSDKCVFHPGSRWRGSRPHSADEGGKP